MWISLRIAWRYLFSKKKTQAINLISWLSMIGMGLGAMVLIVVLSVFNGFTELVLTLQNSFHPDLEIRPVAGKVFNPDDSFWDVLKSTEGISNVSQVLEENAYLRYKDNHYLAKVKGVDNTFFAVTEVDEYIIAGSEQLQDASVSYAILGAGVDYALNTNVFQAIAPIHISVPKRGKKMAVSVNKLFNTETVMPGGVFAIQQSFDMKYVLVPIQIMRDLTKYEQEISTMAIKVSSEADIDIVKNELEMALGDSYYIVDRIQQDEALYAIMKAERIAIFAILCFIITIIAFNIVGALSMLSMEKRRDISILQAMGASTRMIKRIFILQGILSTNIGALVGLGFGLIVCWLQIQFGIIGLGASGSSFIIDSYPVDVSIQDVFTVYACILCIGGVAAYFPANRAAKQSIQLEVH